MRYFSSRLRILAPLTGLALLLTLSAVSAQQQSPVTGISAVHPKFQPPATTTQPTVNQTGVGSQSPQAIKSNIPNSSQRDTGLHQGNTYPTNRAGYPVYPGPNVPLPAQGTYYANPYGYYNNPYDPYIYDNQGYSPGSNNPGYYNGGSYYQPNPYGPTYPAFRGYNEGNRP